MLEPLEHFAFYQPRRLDAEVLIDAICQITGTTETYMSIIPEPFTFLPEHQRAIALPDGSITSSFLEMFGRPARDTGMVSERNNRLDSVSSLASAQFQSHSQQAEAGSGDQRPVEPSLRLLGNRRIDFTWPFFRDDRPRTNCALPVSFASTSAGTQDLDWALINSDEFLFRH